MLEHTATPP